MAGRKYAKRWIIYGANTDVGKTIISSGIVRAAIRHSNVDHVVYVKPIQTGSEEGHSDEQTVRKAAEKVGKETAQNLTSTTLHSWGPAVSPHVAADMTFRSNPNYPIPSDIELVNSCISVLDTCHNDTNTLQLVETAGGVMSPGPSGTPQTKIFSALGIPVILVADGQLGGISTTLTSLESLKACGYTVPILSVIDSSDSRFGNADYLRRYLRGSETTVISFKPIPEDRSVPLDGWFENQDEIFTSLVSRLL